MFLRPHRIKTGKLPVTVLLRALGVETDEQLKAMFGEDPRLLATMEKDGMNAAAVETNHTPGEEALKEIYKRLRPGEPPLVETAVTLLNNLFFDPKRYDLMNVGRFKYNKKVSLTPRLIGRTLARPVFSALTGEMLFDAGEKMDFRKASEAEAAGACEAYIYLDDGNEFKIFSNGTVYPEAALGFDFSEIGVTGKVNLNVLNEIITSVGTEKEAVMQAATERKAELIPSISQKRIFTLR